MASLELHYGRYRIIYRYAGRKISASLETDNHSDAENSRKKLESVLHDLRTGRRELPEGADLTLWLLSGGKTEVLPSVERKPTLSGLIQSYLKLYQLDSKEDNTLYTEKIHFKHLQRHIGKATQLSSITVRSLQQYVNDRLGDGVSVATVKKELGTLASVWNKHGLQQDLVTAPCPTRRLIYPKTEEKQPYMTWAEINRKMKQGATDQIWECLFLTAKETDEVVEYLKPKYNMGDYFLPMFATAAYTGMRRSELTRAKLHDVDVISGLITIREKKKKKGEITFRRAPISKKLKNIITVWLDRHPGGDHLFCDECQQAFTPRAITSQFRKCFDETKWKVLKGWHILRHSFITNCASAGIDQRMIDLWVGHTTEAMRKRYTHLIPNSSNTALARVYS